MQVNLDHHQEAFAALMPIPGWPEAPFCVAAAGKKVSLSQFYVNW